MSRKKSNRLKRIAKRCAAYSAAAAATAAVSQGTAKADPVYHDVDPDLAVAAGANACHGYCQRMLRGSRFLGRQIRPV